MRFVVALLFSTLPAWADVAAQTANMTPDALVQRGIASYRAAHYADAASDLDAAAQALLSQQQMQEYVNTGKFPNLDRFETALVYLTLAQSKLGHTAQAREAVLRLQTAERIDASYAQLSLGADAKEFESIAAKLVPGLSLKTTGKVAQTTPAPAAATTVAEAAPTSPAVSTTNPPAAAAPASPKPAPAAPKPAPVVQASTAPAPPKTTKPAEPAPAPPKPSPAPEQTATAEKLTVQPTIAAERTDRQQAIDALVEQERARIQKEADERIAAIQREADQRVADAQKAAAAQIAALQAQDRRNYLLSLRQADAMAATGKLDQANDIYNTVVTSSDVPREIVAEAAVGLYRTGAFRSAATAFRKLVPYGHGEEDLRYYNAVSLYETGEYDEAKKELACALPYIQVTADVTRYRQKIENTGPRQAAR